MLRNNTIWTLCSIGWSRKEWSAVSFKCMNQNVRRKENLHIFTNYYTLLYLSAPPIASTISLHSFMGGGNGLGSLPRIKPKSTWKRRPSSLRRRLSRCLQKTKISTIRMQLWRRGPNKLKPRSNKIKSKNFDALFFLIRNNCIFMKEEEEKLATITWIKLPKLKQINKSMTKLEVRISTLFSLIP